MPSANIATPPLSCESERVYLGKKWIPAQDARLSVFDHGLLYGDGIYEGLRAYGGQVFMSNAHLDRLERSARCLRLDLPQPREQIHDLIEEGLAIHGLNDAYIRLLVTRGLGPIGPDPSPCVDPQLIIIVQDLPPLHGKQANGIRLALSSVRRCAVDSATAQIKSLNYLPTILGKLEATRWQVDDVVLLDSRGFVAEAPVANVFIVRDDTVFTPTAASGILEGVTRGIAIRLLREAGHAVVEKDLTPYDLAVAEEIFLTGTHAEIVPVREYAGIPVGARTPGPVTEVLLRLFREVTRSKGFA